MSDTDAMDDTTSPAVLPVGPRAASPSRKVQAYREIGRRTELLAPQRKKLLDRGATPEPKRPNERNDEYTRRTGHYPPDWSADQDRAQDERIHNAQMTRDRAYLARWGVVED
jgi:hypothetical protein